MTAGLPDGKAGAGGLGASPSEELTTKSVLKFPWRVPLFDHLVGVRQHRRRDLEIERPGGGDVDRQLELG
jgi:hypothetical protein